MFNGDEYCRPMDDNRNLQTVAAVVAAFGGTKACADWAGVGSSAVSNWITWGVIPAGWHFRMHVELQRRGFDLDPALFGQPAQAGKQKTAGAAA